MLTKHGGLTKADFLQMYRELRTGAGGKEKMHFFGFLDAARQSVRQVRLQFPPSGPEKMHFFRGAGPRNVFSPKCGGHRSLL